MIKKMWREIPLVEQLKEENIRFTTASDPGNPLPQEDRPLSAATAHLPGRASVTAFRNVYALIIALLCACRADAFSVYACFAVNAAAAGNNR